MKKLYYRLTLTATAPLRISNGDNDRTDNDLMLDGRGLPFLPGSSLAGVLRSTLRAENRPEARFQADALFGRDTVGAGMTESRVLVSDATLPTGAVFARTHRDGVGLNKNGTAKTGAKFDFEAAEVDTPFTAVLECGEEEQPMLEALLARVCAEGIAVGGRTTRGYGSMTVAAVRKEFVLPEQLEQWLAFDAFARDAFADAAALPPAELGQDTGNLLMLRAKLAMAGTFAVRVYTTALPKGEKDTAPDYGAMHNRKGQAVIPGSSWAGVFRHHMTAMLEQMGLPAEAQAARQQELDALFGTTEQRARIAFGETAVQGGTNVVLTRNALDRFTQAPSSTALYTMQLHRGGTGELNIRVNPEALTPFTARLLAAAVQDLHNGLMNVGGEGNVGRGLCRIKSLAVNGTERLPEQLADALTEVVR